MSRSKKGKRGVGYEYWSRRPMSNKCGATPGKVTKNLTHRLERLQDKKIVEDELSSSDWVEFEKYTPKKPKK